MLRNQLGERDHHENVNSESKLIKKMRLICKMERRSRRFLQLFQKGGER